MITISPVGLCLGLKFVGVDTGFVQRPAFFYPWGEHTEFAMPKGPKGENRPADAVGLAVLIDRIATSEVEDLAPDDAKDKAAQTLGRKGGTARASSMSPRRRAEIARAAAAERWGWEYIRCATS